MLPWQYLRNSLKIKNRLKLNLSSIKRIIVQKKFNDHLLTMDWRFFYEQTSAATMFDVFCQNVEQAIVKHAPIKSVYTQ